MAILQLHMNESLYLRNPQETELGRKIVEEGIAMIDELGFEKFTFKKLAHKIESTEASIYRYFENKHKLLIYLIEWYWNWLEYRIDFSTQNIDEPLKKLEIALGIVAEDKKKDLSFPQIDEAALYRIVILESDKTYMTKQVDDDNKDGSFKGFKSLCKTIASYIKEYNPKYTFPHSLISTVLQAAHHQLFYAEHLPTLSDLEMGDGIHNQSSKFLMDLVVKTIKA